MNIGDKVMVENCPNLIGRIVSISIDPLEEEDVEYEKKDLFYKVRVWKDFWIDGYFDFGMTEKDLKIVT